MNESNAERLQIELSAHEAQLVIAALRQFEPYWPGDMDELSRADLLTGVREAIDNVTAGLQSRGGA